MHEDCGSKCYVTSLGRCSRLYLVRAFAAVLFSAEEEGTHGKFDCRNELIWQAHSQCVLQTVMAGKKLIQLYLNYSHYLLYVSLILSLYSTLSVTLFYPLDTNCDLGHPLLGWVSKGNKAWQNHGARIAAPLSVGRTLGTYKLL